MTKINSSVLGSITINDVVYRHDVYILPSGKVEERQYGHTFAKEQIEHVLKEEPDTVVIGKGAFGMASLSSDARVLLGRKGIEIAEAATIDTIDESNKPSEIKKVAAILHVTC